MEVMGNPEHELRRRLAAKARMSMGVFMGLGAGGNFDRVTGWFRGVSSRLDLSFSLEPKFRSASIRPAC
jgi:hypothetical protein